MKTKTDYKNQFYRLINSLPKRHKRTCIKLGGYKVLIENAEQEGKPIEDKKMPVQIKRVNTLAKRTLGQLSAALKAVPELTLKKEYFSMLFVMENNSRHLLLRMEQLCVPDMPFEAKPEELKELGIIFEPLEEVLSYDGERLPYGFSRRKPPEDWE